MSGKKGAPLLQELLKIAQRHEQHHQTYLALKQQQGWLRHIDHILDPARVEAPYTPGPERASEAAWELWSYLNHIDIEARGHDSHQKFAQHVRKWTKNLGWGLYACFSEPLLPRTNNGMERFLRTLKGQHRRITGRQSWSRFILRSGAQIAYHDPKDSSAKMLHRLRLVRYDDFCQSRASWRASQEPQLQRCRYRRDPSAFLGRLEAKWSD